MDESSSKKEKGFYPNTELGIDLKLITRKPGRMAVGEYLVLGYIVAGFLVSPHMPYTMSVMDETDIKTWADIGVIFTLF